MYQSVWLNWQWMDFSLMPKDKFHLISEVWELFVSRWKREVQQAAAGSQKQKWNSTEKASLVSLCSVMLMVIKWLSLAFMVQCVPELINLNLLQALSVFHSWKRFPWKQTIILYWIQVGETLQFKQWRWSLDDFHRSLGQRWGSL